MFVSGIPLTTFALLMLPALINLWGISHAMRHVFPKENERGVWVAVCVFLPFLGGVLYLLFGLRRSKKNTTNTNLDSQKENENNVSHEYHDIHQKNPEKAENSNNTKE